MDELAVNLRDRPVHAFGISQCGIHSKGFKSLSELCRAPIWMENLQLLDISGNNAGKSGTRALAKFLEVAPRMLRVFDRVFDFSDSWSVSQSVTKENATLFHFCGTFSKKDL